MNCEDTYDRLVAMKNESLAELERRQLIAHLESCEICQHTARAAAGLQIIKDQDKHTPAEGLFERVMQNAVQPAKGVSGGSKFWLGAGIGGALAASIMLAVMSLGLFSGPQQMPADIAEFQVSLNQARELNVAIDLERDLPGATVRIVLSGGVELDGYGNRRELSWTADLEAGVNKLTLPIVAINDLGGQLLVQVDHENRRITFRVDLKVDS